MKVFNTIKLYESYLKYNITNLLTEELTDGEIDSLTKGNVVIDSNLVTYRVISVIRNDDREVTLVKVLAQEVPEQENEENSEFITKLDPKQLRKFDIA